MNGSTRIAALLGTWGKPVDGPAKVALALALLSWLVALTPRRALKGLGLSLRLPKRREIERRFVLVLAFGAAFLSLGYVAYYLRAGPRIIDATSYYLEGRVLSHGHFAWDVPTPSANFRGRFLLFREPGKLAVIFPPGFPLLLAIGFRFGAPLVVGPILAGLLVLATYALAREVTGERPESERTAVATLAGGLSIVCVALRYHTADTMAHGASALGITCALLAALRGAHTGRRDLWALSGLAVGWVLCTRPVSSLAICGVLAVMLAHGKEWRSLRAFVLGVIPGALFLLWASHAQTGSWLASAQSAYYAASDGPPGCFRYGFGDGVGCEIEHKDFVASRLPHGFGLMAAVLTTLRRLRVHAFDIANFEPLALLVLFPLRRLRSADGGVASTTVTFAVIAGQIFAYAPFYFDGDYPGGGARFFADILPLEHVLIAVAATTILRRYPFYRRASAILALAFLGFSIHGAFEHEALAARDGGRPLYDAEEARATSKGLLFFDTDHGFDLAYDPYVDPKSGVLAARLLGDDHDRLLVERLDHPPAHVYRTDAKRGAVTAWNAKGGSTKDLWHFEAEADWPPLTQRGGWGEPIWASHSCATGGRVLTLHVAPDALGSIADRSAVATIDLPVAHKGKWVVSPRVLRRGGKGHAKLRLIPRNRAPTPADAKLVWEWDDLDPARAGSADHDSCADLPPLETARGVELDEAGATWELTAIAGDVSLDQTTLRATR